MRKLSIRIAGGLVAAVMSFAVVQPAAAHAVRSVGAALQSAGPLTIALGWLHEPAYVGFDNAVQVIVTEGHTPVTAITANDLTVEVSLGNQKMSARPLIPSAIPGTGLGTPGEYEMHFIPTVPGLYTFHIKGTVTGVPVDLTVTAGPTTFDSVDSPEEAEFPAVVPTTGELASRIDNATPRIEALARQTASSASDDATRALVVGIVALVVAVIAVVVGLWGRRQARV